MHVLAHKLMFKSENKRRLAICGTALCLIVLCVIGTRPRPVTGLEVRILDVGQGDAALIRTAGASLLIDAGPNSAEEDLCATLRALGIKRIDTVIFTHPDEDHIGGGDLLLERFSVGTVYFAPADSDAPSFARLIEAAARSGAAVRIGEAGIHFSLGEAEVHLLSPDAAYDESNNNSIITRINYGETALLFMGDAEAEAETALLRDREALYADLLKLGHHGADSSTSAALLDAVKPAFAVISCGKENTYGHPSRRVIDALTARGIAIGRTDREGMLVYRSDGVTLRRE